MSPRVTEVYKSEVRERIIHSAIDSFSRTGFDKTKMDDIAGRLGLSKGTLYLYFRSKEDLFYAICEYFLAALKKQLPIAGSQGDVLTDAERLYDYFRNFGKGNDKVILEMVVESTRNSKLRKGLYEHRLKVKALVVSYLERQRKRSLIRNDVDLSVLASAYIALYDGITISNLIGMNEGEGKKAWLSILKASLNGSR